MSLEFQGEVSVRQRDAVHKWAAIGDEMRSLAAQVEACLKDFGTLKATPRKRKRGYFTCNPDSKKLYLLMRYLDIRTISNSPRMHGLYLWAALDSGACYDIPETVQFTRESMACDAIRLLSPDPDRWPAAQTRVTRLDPVPQMTEGDLAFVVALMQRYREWVDRAVGAIRGHSEVGQRAAQAAKGFKGAIERVHAQAMAQLRECLEA